MNIVIAGGGTGGHLFPGLALAEELRTRGHELLFVGTAKGIEARVLPGAGWRLELIEAEGIKGRGVVGLWRGLGRVPRAIWRSREILRDFRADAVVGVGGYASGPVVLAGALGRRPTAILEQNSIPGITNRILGRVVRRVYTSFTESERFFPARKLRPLGNPIRAGLRDAAARGASAPEQASEQAPDRTPTLLVLGGSQGARAVNELMVGAMEQLRATGRRLPHLVHQTGPKDAEEATRRYQAAGLPVATPAPDAGAAQIEVRPFIDDMAGALAAADLIVGRAGATTIAELTAFGRAAILIPFPHATDDHQRINAQALAAAGAAVVLDQKGLTAEALAAALGPLLEDGAARARMAAASRSLGRPGAARAIADDLLAMMSGQSR
ncbi:MAG TPA: undecaprenyldiphospho-muramoylpentapeptide beta-N-acetylglucosaminyltransferase [Polyangia bacterium]|nr:undecaprenyldiphospho-muramoylpentapeptide beta-N-acetylglucosaminyltransferase [Polyangia bacterium]